MTKEMINAIELQTTVKDTYIDIYGNVLEYLPKIGHITKAGLALYKANSYERVDDFFKKICKPHFEKEISRKLKKA